MSLKRPYQAECSTSIVRHFYDDGVTLQGISLPCGAGKTCIVGTLPHDMGMLPGESLLFIAHRDELITQAADKFRYYNPELTVGIEKATQRAMPDADVVVASVGSMSPGRIKKFDPERFRIIVVDEVHHSFQSAMYQRIMEYFQVHRSRENLSREKLMIGLSATWRRGDKVGAEHLFDKIIFHRSIRDVMKQGIYVGQDWCPYLAPIRGHRELSDLKLDTIKAERGDLRERDLSDAMNTPERREQMVDSYLEHGCDMPAIAFTVDIQHSIDLAAAFRARGLQFYEVSGDVKRTGDRAPIIRAFLQGAIKGLVSCAALEEGTDLPMAAVGLNACPTLSPVKYTQKFGRISRPFPAPEERLAAFESGQAVPWVKPYGIWIDHTDSSTKHSLVQVPMLFGLRPDFDLKGKDVEQTIQAIEEAKAKNPDLDVKTLRSLDDLERSTISFGAVENASISTEIRDKKWSVYPWVQENQFQWALPIRGTNSVLRVRQAGEKEFDVWFYMMGAGNRRGQETTLRQAVQAAERMLDKRERKLLQQDAPWKREAPTLPQCERIWHSDRDIQKRFRRAGEFFAYAHNQWEAGNMDFSKGGIADILNMYIIANKVTHGHGGGNIGRAASRKLGTMLAKVVAAVRR